MKKLLFLSLFAFLFAQIGHTQTTQVKVKDLPIITVAQDSDCFIDDSAKVKTKLIRGIDVRKYFNAPTIHLIGELIGANMNDTLDHAISLKYGTTFVITDVIVTNASTSLTVANNGQIWTGLVRTGHELVDMPYMHNLTVSSVFMSVGNQLIIISQPEYTASSTVYYSTGTKQGSAATADIYVFGYILN